MKLSEKYASEFRTWDWKALRSEALANLETDPDDNTQKIGRVFLGTVFGLTPSGKFYTPYANSNVDACPVCKGKGKSRNRMANPKKHAELVEQDRALRMATIAEFGMWGDGKWPQERVAVLDTMRREIRHYAPERSCRACGGMGSQDAYRDEVWREALEAFAGKYGLSIENGDGDPCDLFASIVVPNTDEDTEGEESDEITV